MKECHASRRAQGQPTSLGRRAALAAASALMALGITATGAAAEAARSPISGVWMQATKDEMKADPRLQVPPIPPPPLNAPSAAAYKAQLARERAAAEAGEPLANDRSLCLPDGVPKMMGTDLPLQILQDGNEVVIITEFMTQVRHVRLGAEHLPEDELVPTFFGDSIGRWEGETLHVDTVGLTPRTILFNGAPHSDELRVVEEFRLLAPDVLENRITMHDAKTFTGPWTVTRVYKRRPGMTLNEFVCTAGNRNYSDADGRLRTDFGPE